MTNREIASVLKNVAAAYTIVNEHKHKFQITAYQKAAESIESSSSEVSDLAKEEKLDSLQGVGPGLRKYIEELLQTGKVTHFDLILQKVPEAMFPLLNIPSFGPKKAYKLVTSFGLKDPMTVISEVTILANENKIAPLEGFGEKSQKDILQSLTEFKSGVDKTSRMVLPFAGKIAEKIITYLKKSRDVIEVYPLGSLRRKKETIGDVDLAVKTKKGERVLEYFTKYPYTTRILEKGDASASILVSGGKHIDLMVQPPENFGSLLQHFTGSREHNIKLRELALKKGLSLSEYGIKNKNSGIVKHFNNEKDFYHELGLVYIDPEIREGTDEIFLSQKNELPKLVTTKDIKGDFHLHSSYPIEPSHDMGVDNMETMIKQALELGYEYIGFSEHNPSVSKHTKKQIIDLLEKRNNFTQQLQKKYKSIRIFSLLEMDILPNGDLAIDDDAFSRLDGVIASVHSVLGMDKSTMTKRVLKALSHKKTKILGHPTGRLLNLRKGFDLSWSEIFEFCRKNEIALEINASPKRLDLPDVLVKRAIESGVNLIIDTDSHAVDQMQLMPYGVSVARRGWATRSNIVNTWPKTKVEKWFGT